MGFYMVERMENRREIERRSSLVFCLFFLSSNCLNYAEYNTNNQMGFSDISVVPDMTKVIID